MQAGVMAEAIRLIRARTTRGTINLNTNGSLPEAAVDRLAQAGLDSASPEQRPGGQAPPLLPAPGLLPWPMSASRSG